MRDRVVIFQFPTVSSLWVRGLAEKSRQAEPEVSMHPHVRIYIYIEYINGHRSKDIRAPFWPMCTHSWYVGVPFAQGRLEDIKPTNM